MPIPIISGPYRTFRDLNPSETYVEYEGSTITIPIRAQLPGGQWEQEDLKLRAYMRLEVFPSYMNGLGTREFQFIIRDWELFGFSPLLNKVFMGHERGYRAKGADPLTPNEQAVMTFCVAHHYEKHGDDDNHNLAPATELVINDLTHHEHDGQGNIYWHVDGPSKDGGYAVRFFRGRLPQNPLDERSDESLDLLLSKFEGVKPKQRFTAVAMSNGRHLVPSLGNTVLHRHLQLRTPLSISWALGSQPKPGASGRIHIVSPAKSLCVAAQGPDPGRRHDSADFPARITYAANYHIYINDTRFVEDQSGVAVADGVLEIPPRDVRVAFQKPQAGEVLGRYVSFGEGCCTGMEPIPVLDFRSGKALSQYWRSARLDVQQGRAPAAPPTLA